MPRWYGLRRGEIRRTLADAIAEEATARTLADLGIGWTVWHDVSPSSPDRKVDHVVLGPSGLFAFMSEDFGGPVRPRKGELIGEAVAGERPVHELAERVRALTRSTRVRFTTIGLVLPDEALDAPIVDLGTVRGSKAVAVRRVRSPHPGRGRPPLGRHRGHRAVRPPHASSRRACAWCSSQSQPTPSPSRSRS